MDSPVVGLRGVEGRDEQLADRSSQLRVVSRNGDLARLCDITGSQVLVRLDGFMRQSMLETWWIPASSLSMMTVVAPYFVCHVRALVVK